MHWVSILIFAVCANLDSLAVGAAYGARRVRIGWAANGVIAAVALALTAAALYLGQGAAALLPAWRLDRIGALMLAIIGLYYLIPWMLEKLGVRARKQKSDAGKYDRDGSGDIDAREAVALGLALALNNAGMGVGMGLGGGDIPILLALTVLFSLLSFFAGNRLGSGALSRAMGRFAEPACGLMLTALGVYELLG